MSKKIMVSFNLNGKETDVIVEPRELLIHTLREKCLHTGPHIGCETSHCGACTVDFNGMSVKSCTVLTVQAEGAEVLSVEGLAQGGELHALQEGFMQEHGLQCGFCTPGMVMTSVDMINRHGGKLDEKTVRSELEGNICRCTGYHNIVKAVLSANAEMNAASQAAE